MKRVIILILVLVFFMSLFSIGSKSIEKKFKLSVKVDKKKGFTTYMPRSAKGRSRIFIYIVKNNRDNSYFLRLRIAYFADSLLHIKQYVFTIDGEEHIVAVRGVVRMQDLKRLDLPGDYDDTASGGICEYYDIAMNSQEIEIMKKIAALKIVKMKYDGTKGFKKIKIHKRAKKGIKQVLDAFEEFTK